MATIQRYSIERLTGSKTEYFDGFAWSTDREDAEEYRTRGAAEEDAAEHGGEVFHFQRYAAIADRELPIINLVAAE